ncbi:BMP family ABC transporter substrate-binding protein [Miniphocaeibacter massiliensis]|uniref:BMP family ABC transporter substrate-binding protein n=1 Tax=Miniphocaeibacter massiliensis TaxID=2041841 RepID=UPI000C1B8FBE|nr:BMP family ABC transporter substrate-binding protein [Miniphocaeibacter massiliensis]
MKKKLLLLMTILMMFALAACGGDSKKSTGEDGKKSGDAISKENIKIGFVHISDPSDKGYTYNHNLGTEKMIKELGLKEDQVINKFNIPESAEAETAIRELAESGCNIIFATSFGFEDYLLNVASEYPEIQFCHATGYKSKDSDLENVHNYFGEIYQARYLSGIAAGLKTKSNKLGYVAAQPFAEVISGFDAFYLGAKSVNPEVEMMVMYTNSWNDPTKEAQVAKALIDKGCDVIGQHCDSTAPATTAEKNGVFHVGYNSNMIEAAPKASLTSAVWDWSKYLEYATNAVLNGEKIEKDWSKGLKDKVVDISDLNKKIVAEGTEEKIAEARAKIESGDWDVFTGPLKDNKGKEVVKEGETFKEPQSAPTFEHVLEGITVVE